jgi:hypothetical protein
MLKRAALVSALALCGLPALGEDRKPARVYTNEDLERVAPRRGETGVLSRPGTPPSAKEAARTESRERDEGYWRREAARVKDRVRTLHEQAARVREQIERAAVRPTSKGRRGREAWAAEDERDRRLREIEARIREIESDLEERARRAGAPPGWLR